MKKLFALFTTSILTVFGVSQATAAPVDNGNSNATIQFTEGILTLDEVSSIDFGANEVSSDTEIYQTTTEDPFIQVTDNRGSGAGWSVAAQMGNFTKDTETTTLLGSKVKLMNGVMTSLGSSEAPAPNQAVELIAGGASVNVVNASSNTGMGTWVDNWSQSDVTLEVLGGTATTGNHTAVITWTLTDAPGQ
jgi:hypothetical protein